MAQKIIDTTTPQPGGKMGDTAKVAFGKVNDNFTELFNGMDGKADASHTHGIAQVTGLQAALDGKMDRVVEYSTNDANSLPTGNFLGNLASGETSNTPTGSWTQIIQSTNGNKAWGFQLAKPWFQDELYLRSRYNSRWTNWFRLWHSGNLGDAFKGANQSLSRNGYQKLPGGLIIQWGVGQFAAVAGDSQIITLPIAFPTNVLACLATNASSTGTGGVPNPPSVGAVAISTSQIRVHQHLNVAHNNWFCWLAIGY